MNDGLRKEDDSADIDVEDFGVAFSSLFIPMLVKGWKNEEDTHDSTNGLEVDYSAVINENINLAELGDRFLDEDVDVLERG